MSKKDKNTLVPELRFPEFKNDGEWCHTSFSKHVEVIDGDRGVNYPKSEDFSNTGFCVFLSAKNVTKNGFVFDELQFISEEKDEALRKGKLQRFDIVLTTRGTVGQFAYFSENVSFDHMRINSGMVILRVKSEKIIPTYLIEYCMSHVFSSFIKSSAFGNAIPQLTVSIIKEFPLFYPLPKEQKKIANCLSSLDDYITTQNQKLEALQSHKKGLLQNLFPGEGETVAKLRFKEFEGDGKWKESSLNSICRSISSGKDSNDPNGNFNLYGSTGIIGKTTDYSYEGNFILIARVGANAGQINIANGQFGVTDNTLVVYLKEPEKLYFTYYSLVKYGLNKLVFGSGQPLITGKQLKDIVLKFPLPEEQQKIADCLSSIDDQIKAQIQKIEALTAHKKGLMQKLFPNPNDENA